MAQVEQLALELASNRKQLLKRLRWTVSVLRNRYQAEFSPQDKQVFDFDAKRLYGANGFYLQWQTRSDPEQPENYENQQTSVGCCILRRA